MRLRGEGRSGLRASSRHAGWSALGLSVVSGAVALALILSSGTTSGSASSGIALGKHGAIATTHMQLSADASAAAAPTTPPPVLTGTTAQQALISAQSDLGKQLGSATWATQNSGVSTQLN